MWEIPRPEDRDTHESRPKAFHVPKTEHRKNWFQSVYAFFMPHTYTHAYSQTQVYIKKRLTIQIRFFLCCHGQTNWEFLNWWSLWAWSALCSRLLRIQPDYVCNLINVWQLRKFAFVSISILGPGPIKWARLPGGSSSQTAPGPIVPGHYVQFVITVTMKAS